MTRWVSHRLPHPFGLSRCLRALCAGLQVLGLDADGPLALCGRCGYKERL